MAVKSVSLTMEELVRLKQIEIVAKKIQNIIEQSDLQSIVGKDFVLVKRCRVPYVGRIVVNNKNYYFIANMYKKFISWDMELELVEELTHNNFYESMLGELQKRTRHNVGDVFEEFCDEKDEAKNIIAEFSKIKLTMNSFGKIKTYDDCGKFPSIVYRNGEMKSSPEFVTNLVPVVVGIAEFLAQENNEERTR